ncbi:sensor histidine kinase [gamma proteobacterium HdN1]|nr:sensor histidine kinase [gamma proteobacterium HdN1]
MLFFLWILSAHAAPEPAVRGLLEKQWALNEDVWFLADHDHSLTIEKLLAPSASGVGAADAWQQDANKVTNFGYTKDVLWLKLDLNNSSKAALQRLLVFSYTMLDKVEVYLVRQGDIVAQYRVGDHYPFFQRPIRNRLFVLPFSFEAQTEYHLFVRVQSTSSMQLSMTLWEPNSFYEDYSIGEIGLGFFFGALLIIAAYNFFLWFSVRDVSYIYYVLFVLSFSGLVATLEGVGFQYLWQDWVWWANHCVVFFGCITLFFAGLFARRFLRLKIFNPRLDKLAVGYLCVVIVVAAIVPFVPYRVSVLLLIFSSVVWSALSMTLGICNYRAGNASARFFILAWGFLLLCNVFYAAGQVALIPRTALVGLALPIGEMVEVLLLSFALADRINILRSEKLAAQLHVLDADRRSAETLRDANLKLQKALALAEEDHRKKDRFIMAISHELRTPLNAISASVGQLNDAENETERLGLHRFIKYGAERLATQVENLIMLAETENRKIQPHFRVFFLDQLLRSVVRVADAYVFNKSVAFRIEKTGESYPVWRGDDYLLVRMLIPLVENACKYTDQGQVVFSVHQRSDGIDFSISDTGIGIPEGFQEIIYESFTQLSEGYQRTHEGLGIGLTACKRIVEVLGAKISVESSPGKGSCFRVSVAMQPETNVVPMRTSELRGHVLIAEDNPVNAKVLDSLVKRFGLTTSLAENGEVALELSRLESFDLILMDLQMPVMDGFTAVENMRSEGVRCPIIAVTANSDYEARMRSIESGMDDILAKPLNRDVLKEKLQVWLPETESL